MRRPLVFARLACHIRGSSHFVLGGTRRICMSEHHDQLDYAGGGLPQETNWWGAFVIGLAGTILVTGIAPVMVTSIGAAAIPSIVIVTLSGWLLCLVLAEQSAMMPERTGGPPSYAFPAVKTRRPRFPEHINACTALAYGHGWLAIYIAFACLLTWNVIAMEAAACYIGECKDPDRDAKIAMNLEGGYGVFIYTMIPISFILVLGTSLRSADPKTIFVHLASKVFGGGGAALDWLVALMLIVA